MPPSGFSKKAIKGILQFTAACYSDLKKEVDSGKHKDFRAAIKYEQRQLKSALSQLHINERGKLVKRKKR